MAIGLAAAGPAAANSKYAAIVVDANTGKTLFSSSADAPRYPASLTKMMTLYLMFEALESGKIKKSTKVPFSTQRRRRAADEARRPRRRIGHRRNGHPVAGDQVGQRRGDRPWRVARRLGGRVRPPDDRKGAQARHDRHDLPQRPRPAQRRAALDGARHGDPRHRAEGALSAVLFLFLDPLVQLRQAAPEQPQPAARPRQGRRRHQDRLHPRFGLQPRLFGVRRQPPHRRRRHGRNQRRIARQAHGRADPEAYAEGFGQEGRRRPRGQGRRFTNAGAHQRNSADEGCAKARSSAPRRTWR